MYLCLEREGPSAFGQIRELLKLLSCLLPDLKALPCRVDYFNSFLFLKKLPSKM